MAPFWLAHWRSMRLSAAHVIFLCLCSALPAEAQIVIEGSVQLPKPTVHGGMSHRYGSSAEVVVAPSNPPAAVVYLQTEPGPEKAAQKAPAEMAQKNVSFAPDLLAIRVGTAVDFPNLDDTYHNVFSYSKAKRFDLGRYRKEEKPATIVFDKPGVVTVHCEIHDRMRGTILVLETPHFQKTDAAGHYRLEHLPAGHYTLKAWVSDDDVRERSVELKNGTNLHVDFPAK
jgi:plastocyanin